MRDRILLLVRACVRDRTVCTYHPFQSISDTKVTMEAAATPEDWLNGERKAEDGNIEFMGSTRKPQPSVSMRITPGSGASLS